MHVSPRGVAGCLSFFRFTCLHLKGLRPVSVPPHPDSCCQLSDFGIYATLVGGASGLSFVCLICVSLISGAETFSSFDWWFGFLSCELPLSPQPCFPGLLVWFLLICGSSNPGSVATTFCQLAACLFTLLMELFEAQGFYIII